MSRDETFRKRVDSAKVRISYCTELQATVEKNKIINKSGL